MMDITKNVNDTLNSDRKRIIRGVEEELSDEALEGTLGLNRLYNILSDSPEALGLHIGQNKLLMTILQKSSSVQEAIEQFDIRDGEITALVAKLRDADFAVAIRNHGLEGSEEISAQIIEGPSISYGDQDAAWLSNLLATSEIVHSEHGATITQETINNTLVVVIGSDDLFEYIETRIKNEISSTTLSQLMSDVLQKLNRRSQDLKAEFIEKYRNKIRERVLQSLRVLANTQASILVAKVMTEYVPRQITAQKDSRIEDKTILHAGTTLALGECVTAIQSLLARNCPITDELDIDGCETFHEIAHDAVVAQLDKIISTGELVNRLGRKAHFEMTKA